MVVVVVDGELNSTGSRLLLTARPLTASTPGEQTQGYCMIGVTVFNRTENEEHWMCCCHVGSQAVDFRIQNSAFYEADRSAFLPCEKWWMHLFYAAAHTVYVHSLSLNVLSRPPGHVCLDGNTTQEIICDGDGPYFFLGVSLGPVYS